MKYILIAGLIFSGHLNAIPWESEGIKNVPLTLTPLKNALRDTSAPYIAADSFRAICDHVCDETDVVFKPENVQYGDTVYLTVYAVAEFFKIAHPKISAPYILVTSHGDWSAPGIALKYLDDPKILAWFGVNCDITAHVSSKFIPIPLGLANKYWKHGNIDVMAKVQIQLKKESKKYLLGLNFAVGTNTKERNLAYAVFENQKYCKVFLNKSGVGHKNYSDYLQDMASCKFIISPHGNGLDCHRTWEALLVGAIPVVKKSTLDPLYADLPIIIVDKWSDITEKFLNEQYNIICSKQSNLAKIYFKYWENLIKATQCKFRSIMIH